MDALRGPKRRHGRSRRRAAHRPIRVLSAGSDRHRDWPTLIKALRNRPDFELRIVTRSISGRLKLGPNMSLVHPRTNDEYIQLYQWADVVALPLRSNLHGSGITVLEEATVLGVPVVVTDVGGLRSYFTDQQVRYVPESDPDTMRQAIIAIFEDAGSVDMVNRAQRRMFEAGLTTRAFAQRHAALSRELVHAVERYPSGPAQAAP